MSTETGATVNPLAMSDEDALNFVFPDEQETIEDSENLETSEEIDNNEDELNDSEEDSTDDDNESEEEITEEEDSEEESDEDTDSDETDEDTDSEEEEESSDEEENTSNDEVAKQLFAPLKANGQEYNIDNVDDARKLMSMGLNYNKKMQAIKPNLKVLRTLDNHGLLDLDKINTLIDLSKGNKDAIAKLIKDSKIDPLDINTEDAAEYTPGTYTASDQEVEIDQVLSDIKDTDTFSTLKTDLESGKWDRTSKDSFAEKPELLRTINDQIANGIYDQIMQKVEMDMALGKHNGMSTLEAYYTVGRELDAAGKLGNPKPPVSGSKPVSKPKQTRVDPKLKQKKRIASSPKGKTSKSVAKQDFNPLSMSDEEFLKQIEGKF